MQKKYIYIYILKKKGSIVNGPNEWPGPLDSWPTGQERGRLKRRLVGVVQRQIYLK
jgi:hypothetical protein